MHEIREKSHPVINNLLYNVIYDMTKRNKVWEEAAEIGAGSGEFIMLAIFTLISVLFKMKLFEQKTNSTGQVTRLLTCERRCIYCSMTWSVAGLALV